MFFFLYSEIFVDKYMSVCVCVTSDDGNEEISKKRERERKKKSGKNPEANKKTGKKGQISIKNREKKHTHTIIIYRQKKFFFLVQIIKFQMSNILVMVVAKKKIFSVYFSSDRINQSINNLI